MLFNLLRKKKEGVIKTSVQVGDRFAVKYDSFETCIYSKEEHPYHSGYIFYSEGPVDMGEYKNLTTVVEYIGNDKYLDLVSGLVLSKRVCKDDLLDTVTDDYHDEAVKIRESLVAHPLGFNSRRELTFEIKQKIMDEVMPKKDSIRDYLLGVEKIASDKVIEVYDRINCEKLEENRLKTLEEEKSRLAKLKELELKKMIDNEENAREVLKTEIETRFDKMFPRVLVKRK